MVGLLSAENLPRGWDDDRWSHDKRAIRTVIWRVGLAGDTISYQDLAKEAATTEPIDRQSPILHGLLIEIATDECAKRGPWITVVVVGSANGSKNGQGEYARDGHDWDRHKEAALR